jgi:hypothetical protein
MNEQDMMRSMATTEIAKRARDPIALAKCERSVRIIRMKYCARLSGEALSAWSRCSSMKCDSG